MIAVQISWEKCYIQHEIGNLPQKDISEISLDLGFLFMDLLESIQLEKKNQKLTELEGFTRFQNSESCLSFNSEMSIEQLEMALEKNFNSTLLTNMILFPRMSYCFIQENGYPQILETPECNQWIKIMTEELALQNEISTYSTSFLHLAVKNGKLVGIDTLTSQEEVICDSSKQIKVDKKVQKLLRAKLETVMYQILNIGKLSNLPFSTNFFHHMQHCEIALLKYSDIWLDKFTDCVSSFVLSRNKRSSFLSRVLGDGEVLDSLQSRMSINDKIENENLASISKNEHLLASQNKLANMKLETLSQQSKAMQKLMVAQFLSLKIRQGFHQLQLERQSGIFVLLEELTLISKSLSNFEKIIGNILAHKRSLECGMLDDEIICYLPYESHVRNDMNSLLLTLSYERPKTQDFIFITCKPLNSEETSFLHLTHGLLKNNSIILNADQFVSIEDLQNETLVYSKTKKISNLIQNDIIILKDEGITGFYCIHKTILVLNTNIFNCSSNTKWIQLQDGDRVFSNLGEVLTSHSKQLRLSSRENLSQIVKNIADFEQHTFNSIFETKTKPWHHAFLEKLKNMTSNEAIASSVGISLTLFLVIVAIFTCTICLCKRICCQDKARLQISVSQPNPSLADRNQESTNQRARRLVGLLQKKEQQSQSTCL